jgi:hypothetical protein
MFSILTAYSVERKKYHFISVSGKYNGSIFYKVKRSDGFCVLGFCFIKNEHPKGFGALEDCPNKKICVAFLTPVALPLTDWKERA